VRIGNQFGNAGNAGSCSRREGPLAKSPEPGYSAKLSPARINGCLVSTRLLEHGVRDPMMYKELGKTGVLVSELALGTWR
jgi:hypothetical protein